MRRPLALTLVLLFSFLLIAPLFAPSAEASLPPCCRRHGKHHCSMMTPLSGTQRGLQKIQEPCPFQRVSKSTAQASAWALPLLAAYFYRSPEPVALLAQIEARSRLSLARTRMKRGPPAVLRGWNS